MSDKINGLMAYLPVEKIFPHPDNPRKDLGDLKELTASISARGVLQNGTHPLFDHADKLYAVYQEDLKQAKTNAKKDAKAAAKKAKKK